MWALEYIFRDHEIVEADTKGRYEKLCLRVGEILFFVSLTHAYSEKQNVMLMILTPVEYFLTQMRWCNTRGDYFNSFSFGLIHVCYHICQVKLLMMIVALLQLYRPRFMVENVFIVILVVISVVQPKILLGVALIKVFGELFSEFKWSIFLWHLVYTLLWVYF